MGYPCLATCSREDVSLAPARSGGKLSRTERKKENVQGLSPEDSI